MMEDVHDDVEIVGNGYFGLICAYLALIFFVVGVMRLRMEKEVCSHMIAPIMDQITMMTRRTMKRMRKIII
jgi:hypothetical protein